MTTTTEGWERIFRDLDVPAQVEPWRANALAQGAEFTWRTQVSRSRHDLARIFASLTKKA